MYPFFPARPIKQDYIKERISKVKKERFAYARVQSEQGRDVFVRNPENDEEGQVLGCSGETVVVENVKDEQRRWDYHLLE